MKRDILENEKIKALREQKEREESLALDEIRVQKKIQEDNFIRVSLDRKKQFEDEDKDRQRQLDEVRAQAEQLRLKNEEM